MEFVRFWGLSLALDPRVQPLHTRTLKLHTHTPLAHISLIIFLLPPFPPAQCWDDCSAATTVNRAVPATWPLSVTSMVRDGSLVAANVAWHAEPLAPKTPSDCLVTWEVSGGGLIGNLLTQTSFVELSLWPDTKYRVQVTCKTKVSERTEGKRGAETRSGRCNR